MGFYDELGVTPVINAAGSLTRLGGNRVAPEVLDAMVEAAASNVVMDELQQRAGAVIAEVTGAEAGYVVSGAAAGLTLAAAACVAGLDPAAMDRLPDTTGLRNEIVVQRGHRNAYDHALRAAGITFVEAGYLGYPGAGGTYPWQIEAAITERTAAIACPILDTPGTLSLPEVAEIARRHDLPVIVDASAALPPRSNLRRFIAEGADLVVYSGGKAIGGPQASGILAGRADLITSAALQHLDMDVRMPTWNRRNQVETGMLCGIPHHGIGRAMKVGREEIAGLIVALRRYVAGDDSADVRRWEGMLAHIAEPLEAIAGLEVHRELGTRQPVPLLAVDIDADVVGFTAYDTANRLMAGDPRVAVAESRAELGTVTINPMALSDDEADLVRDRLQTLFGA
ncbi:MAG TPA: DegT/DnrJ/EryC1/StrS family aminotransferase [Thermomicrobiales bacterium]|nr:DegT/DnrJ/EryC1/StrS family aminotransferase [Thermomicrobiales bacterium]